MNGQEKTAEQLDSENSLSTIIEQPEAEAGQEGQAQAASPEESLAGLLKVASIGMHFAGLKNTAAVWSEANCEALAVAAVPVMRKYAWGQKALEFLMTGGGVEEMALIAVIAPLAFATVKAVKADTAKPEPKPEEKEVHGARAEEYDPRN